MPDTVQILPYQPKNKEQVLNLLRLNTPTYFAVSEEADLADYLDHEREDYYILESNGLVIGCGGINYADKGSTGKISWDILHPAYQGQSMGSRLLTYRIERLHNNKNIKKISVRTSQLAFGFYEKHGFRTQEVIEDYWADGLDLYVMVWFASIVK